MGQIRVKSIENLFENYKTKADGQGRVIINVDEPLASNDNEKNEEEESVMLDDIILPPSLRFNKKAMHISIKPRKNSTSEQSGCTFGPNMSYDTHTTEDDISEIVCMPTMEELASLPEGIESMDDMDQDVMICNEFLQDDVDASQFEQTPLFQYSEQNQQRLNHFVSYTRIAPKAKSISNGHSSEETDKQLLKGIYLRNPRGNHPRNYTQEELFMALNAIKGGLSIYRASQQYKVPRKTLRNWMKRWQIKSVYPMPAQLKRAAEKRKEHQDQLYQAHTSGISNSDNFPMKSESGEQIMANIVL